LYLYLFIYTRANTLFCVARNCIVINEVTECKVLNLRYEAYFELIQNNFFKGWRKPFKI
jgi:hypothetical protein